MLPVKYRIDMLIGYLLDLICSLIGVLTFSYFYPSWAFKARQNILKKRIKERKYDVNKNNS